MDWYLFVGAIVVGSMFSSWTAASNSFWVAPASILAWSWAWMLASISYTFIDSAASFAAAIILAWGDLEAASNACYSINSIFLLASAASSASSSKTNFSCSFSASSSCFYFRSFASLFSFSSWSELVLSSIIESNIPYYLWATLWASISVENRQTQRRPVRT